MIQYTQQFERIILFLGAKRQQKNNFMLLFLLKNKCENSFSTWFDFNDMCRRFKSSWIEAKNWIIHCTISFQPKLAYPFIPKPAQISEKFQSTYKLELFLVQFNFRKKYLICWKRVMLLESFESQQQRVKKQRLQ